MAAAAAASPRLTYAVKDMEAASWRIGNFTKLIADSVSMQRVTLEDFTNSHDLVADSIDFVWQNKATTDFQELRRSAMVYNHLCGAEILEDKAKLALLLQKSTRPENGLKSLVFKNVAKFALWCRGTAKTWGEKLWVAKIPLGNSGSGVWVLGSRNWRSIVDTIMSSDSLADRRGSCDDRNGDRGKSTKEPASRYAVVVQEYVAKPLLWHNRKLQFRVYVVITGDLSCWIYRHGMLQFCNKPFRCEKPSSNFDGSDGSGSYDDEVHITNVSRNVMNPDLFVKEKPCDIASRYPHAFKSMKASLADLVTQAAPFLSYQRSNHHFEFIGADFIVDASSGHAYLIECNCPPNNTGSDDFGTIDDFHQDLCNDLLRAFVLTPAIHKRRCQRERVVSDEDECGLWEEARGPSHEEVDRFAATREPSLLARNGLAWMVYESKAAKKSEQEAAKMIAAAT